MKPAETKPPTDKPSLVNEKPVKAEGAPEKYEAFKLPEGWEMPEENAKEVQGTFKELNLSQEAGQKLVDLYHKFNQQAAEAPFNTWKETQDKWRNEAKTDPEIGPKLDSVLSTISKAIDGLGDAKLATDLRSVMDFTGVGNNPTFIKAMWKLAAQVTEGGHVSGTGPTKFGQTAPGAAERPSLSKSLYPNLP